MPVQGDQEDGEFITIQVVTAQAVQMQGPKTQEDG